MIGRLAGLLFASGGLVSLPATALLHDPEPAGYVHAINLLALVSGAICLLIPWQRLGDGALSVLAAVATLEVALVVQSVGRHGDVFAWYYVLVAVFVGYAFRERRTIAIQSALLFVAFWLPAATGSPDADAVARALVGGPVLLIAAGVTTFLRERLEREQEAQRSLTEQMREDSLTDALTGLGNRRRLMLDLEAALADGAQAPGRVLALLDLNGFKGYNDAFGHPAGDGLLHRLGRSLAGVVEGTGIAYRLGGDEFCVLFAAASPAAVETLVAAASAALAERGDGFSITASHGLAALPGEASDAAGALGLADQRMYADKRNQRLSPARQSSDVLVRLIDERRPEQGRHLREVVELSRGVARAMQLGVEQVDEVVRAAELHDIGTAAVPDAILDKPGPLDGDEQAFIHRHTLVGERILLAAPALAPVARLVRASHERYDGGGYPDGLRGETIPLGARIIAVCDAYDAMTARARPHRRARTHPDALTELRLCSGGQFDPAVVEAFVALMAARPERAAGPPSGSAAVPAVASPAVSAS